MRGVKCNVLRGGLMDAARGGRTEQELEAHLDACPECTAEWERQAALSRALGAMAADVVIPQAGILQPRLMAEFDAALAASYRRKLWRWVPMAAAIVMAAALSGPWAIRSRVAKPAPRTEPAAQERPFVAIPYTLPLEAGERAEVVRMDLPVAAIIAAGLPLKVADAGAHAQADVLVGEDGRARAIRLISISNSEQETDQ